MVPETISILRLSDPTSKPFSKLIRLFLQNGRVTVTDLSQMPLQKADRRSITVRVYRNFYHKLQEPEPEPDLVIGESGVCHIFKKDIMFTKVLFCVCVKSMYACVKCIVSC